MKKLLNLLIVSLSLIECLSSAYHRNLLVQNLNEEKVHPITESVEGTNEYKKASFQSSASDIYHYFKYDVQTAPTSQVSAFRIQFDQQSELMKTKYKVYCTCMASSTTDANLITALKKLDQSTSNCIGGFSGYGHYEGIIKHVSGKTKLGFMLISDAGIPFTATFYFRITERIIDTSEIKISDKEEYSLIPFTINIQKFRDINKSKIVFYSKSRELQMYYVSATTNYPEKLFSGNLMNVFTNPNMVRQKYHGAMTMILLASDFKGQMIFGEEFMFQINLFDSQYLLDYYVSSNSQGRPQNTPLLINMTECSNPYYVILNYNMKETSKVLVIDQIYGKLLSLSVATNFTQNTYLEMLKEDLKPVDLTSRRHVLPKNSEPHIDVYEIKCEVPVMFNFYYQDEASLPHKLNYGEVSILSLKPYEIENVPFFSDMGSAEIVIEIFNPKADPVVAVESGSETVYTKNTLIKMIPMSLEQGINIKERGGLSDTRVIIKVGYPTVGWEPVPGFDYIKFSSKYNTYLFEFPNNDNRYNYTFANLTTSGTNLEDNVKYCFTTNIGAPLKPSHENCYRVSKDNSYSLKFYNPLIMFKDYKYDIGLSYYVTFMPVTDASNFNIKAEIHSYSTPYRNFEGVNSKLTLVLNGGSTLLTPVENIASVMFVQITACDPLSSITTKVVNPYNKEIVLNEEEIKAGEKNYYRTFQNQLMDTELYINGKAGVEVFTKLVGLNTIYTPSFRDEIEITFEKTTNTINIMSPIKKTESLKYTILIDKEGEISKKGLTLCSFVGAKIETLATLTKSITASNTMVSMQINFNKMGLKEGDKFEAIAYIEQESNAKMVFLSDVFNGEVGKIDIEVFHEINQTYMYDSDYVYTTLEAQGTQINYYFTYLPVEKFDVPIGALGIELDSESTGAFSNVICTFVDDGTDAMSMVEAIEEAIINDNSHCVGSQSSVNKKRYNYIFKYEYNDNIPKKLVIKVVNGNYAQGSFNIYVRNDQGVSIEHTDYKTNKEYGAEEEEKKSVIPYIVDLNQIRKQSEIDYVSKVLFYSQYFEMQMYYLPEDSNAPQKLFTGNIIMLYTKPELAIQKYHATTLILLSENLGGQEHPVLGNKFRFHTRMFSTSAYIEYYVSNNPNGRTINYPLSLEMDTCNNQLGSENKLYYILNYNKEDEDKTLHLDMIYGSFRTARIATEINAQYWDQLLEGMSDIKTYQAELPYQTQHIDVIEIECKSPFLINAYYTDFNYIYNYVKEGEVVVKEINARQDFTFTLDKNMKGMFYYSLSLFNPLETPDSTIKFSNGVTHAYTGNIVDSGMIMSVPERVTIINNCNSKTRFIFKIGYGFKNWKVDKKEAGTLYVKENKFVYEFPLGEDRLNYTKVTFLVKSSNEAENVKFCYSTNLGTPIDASKENCFRTGKNIPYSLTFLSPFVIGKNYKLGTEKYYVAFTPYLDTDYISITFTEDKYTVINRNDIDYAKKLNLVNGRGSTILSLPNYEVSKIVYQMKTCAPSQPVEYTQYSALDHKYIQTGKIYSTDQIGIIENTDNVLLENEIEFECQDSIPLFVKHANLGDYTLKIDDYDSSFDEKSNSVIIKKPILNEEFRITVLVSKRDKLEQITQCNLAFEDRTKLADYVNIFDSVTSNVIVHNIDFTSMGYAEGTQIDILVYAEQLKNSKIEFLYPVLKAQVGKVTGIVPLTEYIEDNKYVTGKFKSSLSSNYLYYDFAKVPTGNVASLKISSFEDQKVTKVGCVFVSKSATEEEMISEVNKAVNQGKSVCLGQVEKRYDGFNAIINAGYTSEKSRLVVQVLYGLGEKNLKDGENMQITIKVSGEDIGDSEKKFSEPEDYAPIPYVIDLVKIRQKKIGEGDYVSKLLLLSNTREMQMLYISNESSAPIPLFTGSIMLIYTNEKLIEQKYHGATKMILLTESLNAKPKPGFDEKFRFSLKFFNSATNIQYFVSENPDGRVLNNPTAIEMTSCSQPYYYIMNYNHVESEDREMHLDTIFGEIEEINYALDLNFDNWDSLVKGMTRLDGNQMVLTESRVYFDILEVKCRLPLLINVFYVDPKKPKVTDLTIGDISVLSIPLLQSRTLTFPEKLEGPFIYSFNVLKPNRKPNIQIIFNDEVEMNINENGLYTQDSLTNYENIKIKNLDSSSGIKTRVIFKFGYVIETRFVELENKIYSNKNDPERKINLYGYKFDTTDSRLNFTGVDFEVKTEAENVKFCYSTNLGTYIEPSVQNCFRVGKSNSYIISVLNPLVMYKDYHFGDIKNYYVGFRTMELTQSITIIPKPRRYNALNRNLEGSKNKIMILELNYHNTILTAPKNNEKYIFTHIHTCTKNKHLGYEFYNAYNSSNLGYNGEIPANTKNAILSVENPKLDTELKIIADYGVEVYVKHIGLNNKYLPVVHTLKIGYNNQTCLLNWTQPIDNEEFTYTIYIDKPYYISRNGFTLCSLTERTKLGHYSESITTNSPTPNITIDFSKPGLGEDYRIFEVIIVAEQNNNGRLTFMSEPYNSTGISPSEGGEGDETTDQETEAPEETNTGLIVIVVILVVVIVGGGILAIVLYRKYRSKGVVNEKVKETSMALITGTKNEKMVESQAEENNAQVDP